MALTTLPVLRPTTELATSERVLPGTRRVLGFFVGFTLLATWQLLVVGAFSDAYFAWTITGRLTSGFLGAAYAAGFVLAVLALRQQDWRDVRVAFLTVAVFTGLTLVPTLQHLHKFHIFDGGGIARLAAWVWLAVYVLIPLACLVVIVRQLGQPHVRERMRHPLPRWLIGVLAVQGVVLALVGGVLFVQGGLVHHFAEGTLAFWPWPLMPLGAQVIGAWLLALAVATGLTLVADDLRRLQVPAATYAAFGLFQLLVLARYAGQTRPDHAGTWLYAGVLASVVLTGAYGCWASSRSIRSGGVGPAA